MPQGATLGVPPGKDVGGALKRILLPGADGDPQAVWGLHRIDANLAMGNRVEVVGRQARAWKTQQH